MPRANSVRIELTGIQANRFWSNVGGMSQRDGCWLWSGRVDGFGYGHFKVNGRSLKAHRVSWTLRNGEIASGVTLDHLCRIPACVNPAHLEAVSNKENILRGESPTAINARRTHCIRGHELSGANIWRRKNGNRECRMCWKDRARENVAETKRAETAEDPQP